MAIAAVPAGLVPMRLPCTTVPLAPVPTCTPLPELPEITLRAAADVPPIVLPVPAVTDTPVWFADATAASVRPIQLPSSFAPEPLTATPADDENPTIEKPRTVAAADTVKPLPDSEPAVAAIFTTGPEVQPGWACASITIGVLTAGSALAGEIVATPPENAFSVLRSPPAARFREPPAHVVPFGIMNTRCSAPAARPDCASDASPPSALAFVIAWRSEPAPVSFVLTIVEKLKPKSTPVTAAAVVDTVLADCTAFVPAVTIDVSVPPALPCAASASDGDSPPTRSASGLAVPVAASVRKVCTPARPGVVPPVRVDFTEPLTTRTVYVPAACPVKV